MFQIYIYIINIQLHIFAVEDIIYLDKDLQLSKYIRLGTKLR